LKDEEKFFMSEVDTADFLEHFLDAERRVPDFFLMAILAKERSTSDFFDRMIQSQKLLDYVTGRMHPSLNILQGIVWKDAEDN